MNNAEYISKIKKFSISKIGEEDKENKDSVDFNKFNGAFCISDGVSGASFSRDWSKLIVSNFIENPFETNDVELSSWLGPIQKKWFDLVPWEKLQEKGEGFYEKAQDGGSATFLGGHILEIEKQIILKLWAIGDSNLFVIRDWMCVDSFPIDDFEEFGIDPDMLFSMSKSIDDKITCMKGTMIFKEFNLKKGDILIAASDSISEWFLKNKENPSDQPWIELCGINSLDEFKNWVEDKVKCKNMKNDDSTLLVVEI